MDLVNCKKCDRMYANDGIDLCPKCRSDDNDDFKVVKEYLYDHPSASIKEVSDETEVATSKILRFLRQGKIEISQDSENLILDCERCGKPIRSGRYCNTCVNELKNEFKEVSSSMQSEKPEKTKKSSGDSKLFIADRHDRNKKR